MSHRNRWLAILLGIGLGLTTAPAARATPPKSSTFVSPTMEIAVLDPNVDPLGRPAIVPKGIPGTNRMEIEIPEAVIVHRFYYTGDRSFQAQFLPGGPCIVAVKHPKCAERLYIPVQMIPGAPRVTYTSHSIDYDFGKQGITIRFCTLTGCPKVEYRNCMKLTRRIDICHDKVNKACKEFADRSGLTEAKQTVGSACKNVCKDTADVIGKAGKLVMMPVNAVGQLIPGAQMLKTTDEDRAQRLRDAQVTAAQKLNANQNATIPQNR